MCRSAFHIRPRNATAVALTIQQTRAHHTPLTWSCVPWGTVAVRPCLSPAASIRIVACQDAVAFVRCAPVAFINAERVQGDAYIIGRTMFQGRLTFRRDGTTRDVTAIALVPSNTVEAHRLKACSGSFLLFKRKRSKLLPQVYVAKRVLSR